MNRRLLIIIIAGAIVLIVLIGSLLLAGSSNPNPTPSGTPAQDVTGPDQAKIFGVDDLTSIGVTGNQADSLKYALIKYAKKSGADSITITNAASVPRQPETDNPDVVNFDVTVDTKTGYKGSISSTDLTSVTFQLKDKQGKLLFDSGLIDIFNGIGN